MVLVESVLMLVACDAHLLYYVLFSPAILKAYDTYSDLCEKQKEAYNTYWGPVRKSTICRACGCRRACGRKGFIFCTEGCDQCCYLRNRQPGDPPPPFEHRDIDDENDASVILRKVMGDPPANVVYTRWEYDEERNVNVLVTYPKKGRGTADKSAMPPEDTPAEDVLIAPSSGGEEREGGGDAGSVELALSQKEKDS